MQKTAIVLLFMGLSFLLLESFPALAGQEVSKASSTSVVSSSVKLKKILALALILSEGKYSKKKSMRYFPLHSNKTVEKGTEP